MNSHDLMLNNEINSLMSNADQEVYFLSAARFLLNLGTPVPA